MVVGMGPLNPLDERSRATREDCKVLLAIISGSGLPMNWCWILNLWRGRVVIDVKSALRFRFETIVRLHTLFIEENRSFGNVVMAVDSTCNVFSDVKL